MDREGADHRASHTVDMTRVFCRAVAVEEREEGPGWGARQWPLKARPNGLPGAVIAVTALLMEKLRINTKSGVEHL